MTYCRQAGVRALARSAHGAAAGCFERALAALAESHDARSRVVEAIDLLNGKELSNLYFSQTVTDELQAGFPPQEGEQWWGYFLTLKVKPGGMRFETVLHLEPVVLQKPNSQTVPILACYEDQALNLNNLKNILQGHSVFVAPNPPAPVGRRR